jgi:hypothetical protein
MCRKQRVILVAALVAGVFAELPRAAAPQDRTASGVPAGGDAVILWNAHAGEAATKACIARSTTRFTSRACTR